MVFGALIGIGLVAWRLLSTTAGHRLGSGVDGGVGQEEGEWKEA